MRCARICLAVLLVASLNFTAPAVAQQTETPARSVVVFAASSLKTALDEVGNLWLADTGIAMRASYASSGALVRQIENGAPAELFISADTVWMAYAAAQGLIRGEPIDLVRNSLVLIAPVASTSKIDLGSATLAADLVGLLGPGRLAIGSIRTVPAGRYAEAALRSLKAWDAVATKLAPTENVRSVLALVSRGEAPLGIVYLTDAKADPTVRILATFPSNSHPAIVYPAAVLSETRNPAAERFLEFLRSPSARKVWQTAGFGVIP